MSNCKGEALVRIDRRGQMVLPKEVRDRANIHTGDKLVVITRQKEGKVRGVFLIKAGDFAGTVKERCTW